MKESAKKVKLSASQEFDNYMAYIGSLLQPLAYVQFTINSYRASARHFQRMRGESTGAWFRRSAKQFRFIMPKKIEIENHLTGVCCVEIMFIVQEQSTPTSPGLCFWAVMGNGAFVGIRSSFYVPGPQAWKADVLLRQTEGGGWYVVNQPVINDAGVSSREYARLHPSPWAWRGGSAKVWSFEAGLVNMVGRALGLEKMMRQRARVKVDSKKKTSKLL